MNLSKCMFAAGLATAAALAADRSVVLIAGKPSHGPMAHEHNAGVLLLKKGLSTVPGLRVTTHLSGWPADSSSLDSADAILLYSDGANGHMAFAGDHSQALDRAAKRGAGIVCVHYAVEPPFDEREKLMIAWIGGAFELNYSVNPIWEADFRQLPKHPITRGVKPFRLRDEWYYNMRFVDGKRGLTPILSATPPNGTLDRKDGPRSGNPAVRAMAGQPQHVAWAYTRPGGGRGFGFTGGHFHQNWGDENFRKIVLNAVVWAAKAEVPKNGVTVAIAPEELTRNLDPKPGK